LRHRVEKEFGRAVRVSRTRAGYIPGEHRVGFDSVDGQVLLIHSARSRVGFAIDALAAAQWIIGKKGFFDFSEVADEIFGEIRKAAS
jgi:4-hydroxy-tetrahydrodipicolinate reductase